MASTVTYVSEDTGQVVTEEIKISSVGFSIRLYDTDEGLLPEGEEDDATLFSPAVIQEVEFEGDGTTSTISDMCGHTQRSRQTDGGWMCRAQGLITDEDREGNLSLAVLRDVVASADSVEIRTDIDSGRFVVSNTIITQANDLFAVETEDTEGQEKAFSFQLQLGEEDSNA